MEDNQSKWNSGPGYQLFIEFLCLQILEMNEYFFFEFMAIKNLFQA